MEKLPKLKEVGGWTVVELKKRQVLLVRDTKSSIKGLSAVCTHQRCLLSYNPKSGKVECDCHRSHYDLKGKVLSGPAPRSLKSYPAEVRKGRLVVTLDDI
jgi:Rieske Fe-S protein